jgi:hypothetical protein
MKTAISCRVLAMPATRFSARNSHIWANEIEIAWLRMI